MTFSLLDHFKRMAEYNQKANHNLYSACAQLTEDQLQENRPGFTTSIFGMLSHIYNGDQVWIARFRGNEVSSTALFDVPANTFSELHKLRQKLDHEINEFVDGLTEEPLHSTIRYINNVGNTHEDPTDMLITHFFNHQTYHRGQINSMLKQAGIKPSIQDMHRVLFPNPVSNN